MSDIPPRQMTSDDSIAVDPPERSDLSWVAVALAEARDEVLSRWLELARAQPFHRESPGRAVADHIPRLFDALVALLRRGARPGVDPGEPLDDPEVLAAARAHAYARAEQGLQPAEVLIEFRLLRREVWRALSQHLTNSDPTRDVIGAQFLVNDALDGAIAVGLDALTTRVDEIREDFLATTLHEIRQPMTTLKGLTQLALRRLNSPEPDLERVRSTLYQIEAAADRLVAVTTTQADISRVALGRLEIQPAEVDLVSLTRQTIAEFDAGTAARVRLSVEVFDPIGWWDPERLMQVVRNLLGNAVKYSPTESRIEVTIEEDTSRDELRLSVHDEGFGIDPAELPRLFQRYARAKNARERGIDGLGIGLFLCRGIVEAHGGRIWAESAGLDQGTTIHILLPRRAAPVAPDSVAPASHS